MDAHLDPFAHLGACPGERPLLQIMAGASIPPNSKYGESSQTKKNRFGWCEWELQATLDNSNLQGKLKKVPIIGSSSYRGYKSIENDPKENRFGFELALACAASELNTGV